MVSKLRLLSMGFSLSYLARSLLSRACLPHINGRIHAQTQKNQSGVHRFSDFGGRFTLFMRFRGCKFKLKHSHLVVTILSLENEHMFTSVNAVLYASKQTCKHTPPLKPAFEH